MEKEMEFLRSLKPLKRVVIEAPPHIACGEYLQSKKVYEGSTKPLCERSIKLGHHFILKKFNKVEDELRAARLKAKEKRRYFDQQWKEISDKQEELRNTFIKFNQFMEENEQKRVRATKKKKEMTVILEKKSEDLEKLKQEFEQMKKLKSLLDDNIKKYASFEKFLKEVVKCGNFENINDIFSRYHSLVQARNDLTNLQENSMQELENTRSKIDKVIAKKFIELKGLDNTVRYLHDRYAAVKAKRETIERSRNDAVLAAMDKVLELQYAKDSCWEMYEHICKRKNRKPIYKNDYANQLEIIKKEILKLCLVNRMVEAIQDEDWSPLTERESTSDSIVANVVSKFLSKK